VGDGTRLAPFSVVAAGAVVGEGCTLSEHAVVCDRAVIGDAVVLEPGAIVSGSTRVERGALIGAGAMVAGGLTVGENAQVRAGAVVERSVPPHAIVAGNPAHIVGYAGLAPVEKAPLARDDPGQSVYRSHVEGVTLRRLPLVVDLRGKLTFGELPDALPFTPRRFFMVFDVPGAEVRGEHAHRTCHQFLVCVRGSCSVVVDDGERREELALDSPTLGLYLPPMVWATQYGYSVGAALLVLASDPYDAGDYIRDYHSFIEAKRSEDGSEGPVR
jgi:hypothetical protein